MNQLLPRGCHTFLLTGCKEGNNVSILLSSTSQWYQLTTNQSRIYTQGIVFVEVNAIALPVSLTGAEIVDTHFNFQIIVGSLSLQPADGTPYGKKRSQQCFSFVLTPKYVRDFLSQNSFFATVVNQLQKMLPDWLKFHQSNSVLLGINDVNTALLQGSEIENDECRGAPLFSERMYSVFKFGTDFGLSVYGQQVRLPKQIDNKKVCIIVDICQDFGGSVFLILPDESRDLFDNLTIFKMLSEKQGLKIRPKGLGVSLLRHINVSTDKTALQMWNGDTLFTYPYVEYFICLLNCNTWENMSLFFDRK